MATKLADQYMQIAQRMKQLKLKGDQGPEKPPPLPEAPSLSMAELVQELYKR